MKTRADNTRGEKSRSAADDVSQRKAGEGSPIQLEDNRPETTAQRRMQGRINNRPEAKGPGAMPGKGLAGITLRGADMMAPGPGTIQLMKGKKVKGQKGTFIGVPAGIHIHIVGDNTHLQIGKSRYNFDETEADTRMQNAYDELVAQGEGKPGYEACKAALEKELGIEKVDEKT